MDTKHQALQNNYKHTQHNKWNLHKKLVTSFQKQHVKAIIGTSLIRTNINQIQLKNGALYIQNLIMPVKRFGREFLNNLLNAAGDTKISFLFKIIHRIIPCNQCLKTLMIKKSEQC